MTGFERIVRASARRPARVLAVVAVLAVAGGVLALRLEPSAAMDTLVGRGADSYQATETYRERFGDHSVLVLVRGELPRLVLNSNLGRLVGLEGCLSGNKPEGQAAPGGRGSPCDRLAQTKPVQVVYGPGTFVNAAAGEINDQIQVQMRTKAGEAARAERAARRVARAQGKPPAEQKRLGESARQLVYAQFVRDLLQVNLRYGLGLTQLPSIDDPDFVSALVFDASRGAETPKARFAYLFPSSESALIQVRLKPDLTDDQREEAVALVREAVRMPRVAAHRRGHLHGDRRPRGGRRRHRRADRLDAAPAGGRPRADGAGARARCSAAACGCVPLAIALAAVAITFGATALLGLPLTMASIAVLPVLLGLGVDYAIQYQARVQEEGGPERAARVAVPVIATAALATGVGFLVLLLSPVPMVRGVRRAAGGRHRDRLRAGADGRHRGAVAAPARRRGWRARCAAPASSRRPPRGGSAARSPGLPAAPARRPCAGRCGGRGACWRSGWRSPSSAGGSTAGPRWCPTSTGSSRRTWRPCRTSRRSSRRPAWRARSTS